MKTLVWKREDVCQSNILKFKNIGANYPTSREGHTFTFISKMNLYYLFGGISSKRHNELFVYDSSTNSWTMSDSKGRGPIARCYHAAWYDGKLVS